MDLYLHLFSDQASRNQQLEEDDDSGGQKEDRKYKHRKHPAQVQSTISADRTGDSVYQRTAQIFQAILPTVRKGQESKDQQDISSHNNGELLPPVIRKRTSRKGNFIKNQDMATQNPALRSLDGPDTRTTNSEAGAGLVPHPTLSSCILSISEVSASPEGCSTADLSALRRNLESLKASLVESRTTEALPSPEPRCQMIYRVNTPDNSSRMYLDQPQWTEGDDESSDTLIGSLAIQSTQSYLDRHPEVCFDVYRDFSIPESGQKDVNNTSSVPKHDSETIETTSTALKSALMKFIQFCGFVRDATGSINALGHDSATIQDLNRLSAPYLAFYHGSRQVKKIIDSGKITRRCFKYIFKPGDVVVQKEASEVRGLLCSSWVTEELVEDTNKIFLKDKASKVRYTLMARHWNFNGVFSCNNDALIWETDANNNSQLEIDSLSVCPLAFAGKSLADKLRRRGERIWKCRTKCLVSYHEDSTRESHYSDDERYMIDMAVYRELHKPKTNSDSTLRNIKEDLGTDDLGSGAMKRDGPPSTEFLYLLPMMIKGFNLRKKKWVDLKVDNIGDVVWNEIAFERLVPEEKTKSLIRALVSEQIETTKSTDLISGKGNGLIMLLHGGPGTGKTLTAESVAEIARKPLYPVTCGDIGTEPEDVENYLESVLHLGKTWECVVLLDEADVFLEQRSLQDLHRNALVSVFLRVLEYYEGILILTSNRVGTFDEAFKSRIQLAIHYSDLSFYQRTEIWKNFISRLEDIEEEEMDAADLRDNIENLAQFKMNGREIRNAITNARQYTRWQRKQQRNPANCKLDYSKMKLIIDTSIKFDDYIKELNGEYENVAVDEGLRAEQRKNMSTSKGK
ncbi:uncharacterized protein F4812DRAFT_465752 [Daldinia caldariorum]|uniref:uncharacterized protein n=1 Tax=Daldinia caldariorum TaxID=326644 RepID=UPI0020073E0A|nr:uncharacterized protein F4812DRAFT_465752 [Daldinia caldariorum]KAI1466490.1 hypothetical protein F4812DRAFT_465752 [Daldinia caldariorum]